jgi:outer membrane protein OmpA-like peptidoglycan-associated protein
MRISAIAISFLILAACGAAEETNGASGAGAPEAAPAATAEPAVNLLTLAEGAVVVSASTNDHGALSLTDGADGTNWSNGGPRFPAPYTFVFELRAPTRLARVGVVGAGARPGGVAGASANMVRVEASAEGPDSGFVELGAFTASEDGETLISASLDHDVRWVRFVVESNHSGADWTYLDGVSAYGAQTPPMEEGRFAGVFQIRAREFVELKQDGTSISGCFVEAAGHAVGELSGGVVDGVARLAWRRTDIEGVGGVALLVIDSRGQLNGVRYRDRSRTVWAGGPAPEGTITPCSTVAPPANPIAEALENEGEARIYDILFDFDRATLKSSSEPALRQLLEALQGNQSMAVDIEGHTDAVGEDAYNLSLSQQRAEAVVVWLIDHGVPNSRLNPVGKGESEPAASNDTADGRALNRRVEVRRR